jgi:hypothetical protein
MSAGTCRVTSAGRSGAVRASPSPAQPWEGMSVGQPSRRQAGSATLIALALTVFVMCGGVMALDVGLLVVARARAQTAADLAALAALTPAGGGQDASRGSRSDPASPIGNGGPASRASSVAAANGAELVACACGPTEVVVTVRRRVRVLPSGMLLSMTARARAVLPGLNGPEPERTLSLRSEAVHRRMAALPWRHRWRRAGRRRSRGTYGCLLRGPAYRPTGRGPGPADGRTTAVVRRPNERDPVGSRSLCGLVVAGWDRDGQAGWRWMRGKRHL